MSPVSQLDVSVLIATRDRAELLGRTLESLAGQRTTARWEVIVIDNGGTDSTAQVLADFAPRLPLTSIYFPAPGKNRALNRGLNIARGTLALFTDDDIDLGPDWIESHFRASEKFADDAIFGGPVVPRFESEPPDWMRRHWFAGVAFADFRPDQGEGPLHGKRLPCGGNLAIRRDLLRKHPYREDIGPGGTDFAMGSEQELLVRLTAAGHRAIYIPDAAVSHHVGRGQLVNRWQFDRARRFGRGEARMAEDAVSRRVLGIPWYFWVLMPLLWIRHQIARFQGAFWVLQAGIEYHRLLGRAFEHRFLTRHPELRCGTAPTEQCGLGPVAHQFYTPIRGGDAYMRSVLVDAFEPDSPHDSHKPA